MTTGWPSVGRMLASKPRLRKSVATYCAAVRQCAANAGSVDTDWMRNSANKLIEARVQIVVDAIEDRREEIRVLSLVDHRCPLPKETVSTLVRFRHGSSSFTHASGHQPPGTRWLTPKIFICCAAKVISHIRRGERP